MKDNLFELYKKMSATTYISAEKLAKVTGVSVKTVRNRLSTLDEWLKKNDASLISKPRYGYRISTENYDVLYQKLMQEQEDRQGVPDNLQERVQYVLLYLLCQDHYVKTDDLILFLYISKGTLSGVLKETEKILNNYQLHLDRRPNYGIKVIGKEFDIRNCMLEYFVKRSLPDLDEKKQKMDIDYIAALTENLTRKYDVHLSEISYENIVLILYITLDRLKREHYVESLDEQQNIDRNTPEFHMLEEITDNIEKDYSVIFHKEELDYLYLHLMSKQTTKGESTHIVIGEEVSNLVDDMLEFLYHETMFDFYSDLEVQMLLKQHMAKMDIRIRYHIFLKNPMLQEIKDHHFTAYTIAAMASTVLKNHYKTDIPEEETGYLALIFSIGLECRESEKKQKFHILIVCTSGKGSSQLLKYEYMHRFREYIDIIHTCDMIELKNYDLQGIDFVFTTVPIPWELPKPIIEIGLFLHEREIPKILNVLKNQRTIPWEKYFLENGFCDSLRAQSKEDALRKICMLAREQENIGEDLFSSVMERESYGPTDFGDLIAIPHPNRGMTKHTSVYVSILEKPIPWEHHNVQIVFLTLIGTEEDKKLPNFYEVFLDFVLDKENIECLLEARSYKKLIELLER